jgi:hypothetical protein
MAKTDRADAETAAHGDSASATDVARGLSPGYVQKRQAWIETTSGTIRIATMFVILIIGLIAGPAVSL